MTPIIEKGPSGPIDRSKLRPAGRYFYDLIDEWRAAHPGVVEVPEYEQDKLWNQVFAKFPPQPPVDAQSVKTTPTV